MWFPETISNCFQIYSSSYNRILTSILTTYYLNGFHLTTMTSKIPNRYLWKLACTLCIFHTHQLPILYTYVWCVYVGMKALPAFKSIISMKITVNRLRIFQKRNIDDVQDVMGYFRFVFAYRIERRLAQQTAHRYTLCNLLTGIYVSFESHCCHRAISCAPFTCKTWTPFAYSYFLYI